MMAMFKSLRKFRLVAPPSSLEEKIHTLQRVWFLRGFLWVQVFVAVLYYLLPQSIYDPSIHLLALAVYLSMLVALRQRVPTDLITHVVLLVTLGYIAWVAAQTGGINAVVMIWMTVVILPATLLLERSGAIFWTLVAVLFNLAFMGLTNAGWMGSQVSMAPELAAWTWSHKVLVVGMAMVVVWVAERMHSHQVEQLDQSNLALEKTAQALRQAQAHKDEFIASVGHELRTPMNAILGLNGLLKSALSNRPEDVEIVGHIRTSTEQLLGLVNDILDFSQLQAGHLSVRDDRFDLCETVRSVVHTFETKARMKGLSLSLACHQVQGEWVRGDRQRLQQVLKNLLDNAFKFTHEGQVQVRIQREVLGYRFEVEDTGIGIAQERQQQVFNRFEHADAQTNREYGGAGLGLSICERLVSLQGGHIGVSSLLGEGTLFWFDLPLGSTEPELVPHAQPTLSGWRILLVDDNAVNLMVARMMLLKLLPQVQVTEAVSGAMALQCLREQHFDLVLMDMVMPEMDGLAVTQTLRTTFPAPVCHVPVLGLTASTHPTDRDRCMAAGMNDVLNKPLDEAQFLAQISQLSQRVQAPADGDAR
jgi:signal transduction histidine kinase/ActR/RegA family two-component response regulator